MQFKILLTAGLLFSAMLSRSQSVSINNDGSAPDNSALLDMKSNVKGVLLPRMLQSERNAISSPASGLMIYQTDVIPGLYVNTGAPGAPVWTILGPELSGTLNYVSKFTGTNTAGNSQIYDNGTNIGIGTSSPLYLLHLISATSGNAAYIVNNGGANNAVYGLNGAGAGAGLGSGVIGQTSQSGTAAAGVKGFNSNASGTAVVGAGNNTSPQTLLAGSGGAFTGTTTGLASFATTAANGTGIYATGNNVTGNTLVNGSGAALSGFTTGVYAQCTSSGVAQSLYTYNFGSVVSVNYWNGSVQYKINGTGTVSTLVKGNNNETVTLHAPETPEIYFQDFGSGMLSQGKAHITLDPVFAKNVLISDTHPLRVFIQPEGDCKGVFVTNKTAAGFDVVELDGGHSDIPFQWTITCNRADEDFGNGRISKNADARFEKALPPPAVTEQKVQKYAGN